MKLNAPIDPPAEIEQYSNSPSNIGQSSPTLSACQPYHFFFFVFIMKNGQPILTLNLLLGELMCVIWIDAM